MNLSGGAGWLADLQEGAAAAAIHLGDEAGVGVVELEDDRPPRRKERVPRGRRERERGRREEER